MSIGNDSRFILKDVGRVAGLFDVTGRSDYPRSVAYLEQTTNAPSGEDARTLVGSACDEALMERRLRNLVVDRELSFFSFPGLVNDSTCLCVDCSREPWVSHHGVVSLVLLLFSAYSAYSTYSYAGAMYTYGIPHIMRRKRG